MSSTSSAILTTRIQATGGSDESLPDGARRRAGSSVLLVIPGRCHKRVYARL
jgi:hypothetical protein